MIMNKIIKVCLTWTWCLRLQWNLWPLYWSKVRSRGTSTRISFSCYFESINGHCDPSRLGHQLPAVVLLMGIILLGLDVLHSISKFREGFGAWGDRTQELHDKWWEIVRVREKECYGIANCEDTQWSHGADSQVTQASSWLSRGEPCVQKAQTIQYFGQKEI